MNLFTSYYGKSFNHPKAVAISCGIPSGFEGRVCKLVAPPWSLVSDYKEGRINWALYTMDYMDMLDRIGERAITKLFSEGDVLLCYEKPGEHCHRHLLAEWLNRRGHHVVELGDDDDGTLNSGS